MHKPDVLDERIIEPRPIDFLACPPIAVQANRAGGEAPVDRSGDSVLWIVRAGQHRLDAVRAGDRVRPRHLIEGIQPRDTSRSVALTPRQRRSRT